ALNTNSSPPAKAGISCRTVNQNDERQNCKSLRMAIAPHLGGNRAAARSVVRERSNRAQSLKLCNLKAKECQPAHIKAWTARLKTLVAIWFTSSEGNSFSSG